MSLQSEREVANTREKLRRLETRCEELQRDDSADKLVRDLTLQSLRRMINQFKEEIARFECRQAARPSSA
jgi:hypothetical protein